VWLGEERRRVKVDDAAAVVVLLRRGEAVAGTGSASRCRGNGTWEGGGEEMGRSGGGQWERVRATASAFYIRAAPRVGEVVVHPRRPCRAWGTWRGSRGAEVGARTRGFAAGITRYPREALRFLTAPCCFGRKTRQRLVVRR
jgi:hypothetical protein